MKKYKEVSDLNVCKVWCPQCGDSMRQYEVWHKNNKYIEKHIYSCFGCDVFFELKELEGEE